MSGWIVYSKDGSHERCKLRSLEYGGTAMGERAVTATFDFHSEVAFEVFDYIEYRGERFELEAVPTVKKLSSFEYQYELRFVSLKYELERCEMRDLVPSDNGVVYPTPLTFSFTGDVRYLTDRIQACLDAMYGAGVWKITIAEGTSSEEKNITIAQQNCWNALALVNSTYGLNFYIKGRTITIGGEQPLVSHTFEYGKGNGLYEIERASDTETGIVTKLRAYGSTRNLDYSYPKKPEWSDSVLPVSFALSPLRLMLPSFKTDGKTDYVLADDAAIAKYGIREASMVYDDIYPSIAGATYNGQAIDEIKAVDAVDESQKTFVVYLHELGFDLEEHLTTSDAQISMKSGALQGYTFTISSIEKQTGGYKITLGKNSLENSEESGVYVPNANWNMKAGDKFVLLNILMPQKYIRDAENRLLARANEYLAQYSKTNFSYNIGLHDKFLIQNPSVYDSLIEGSKLKVYDKEIGIDEEVTIQSITITENLEDNILPQVKVTLNNEPSASTLDRIQGKLNEVAAETAANGFTTQSEIMAQYRRKLDKPFFDKLFVAIDENGNEIPSTDVITPIAYIKAKYHVASVGGFTMYAMDKDVDVPSLASGLPFDGRTIWYNPDTNQIEVIGGTGGGSGEGVSNFWDLSGIPSWITNPKPKYTYSEIEGTPDLSGYATQSWVENKKYLTAITSAMVTSALGFTPYNSASFTSDNIKSTLGISDWALASSKPSYTTSEVSEGTNLYFTNARAVSALAETLKSYVTLSGTQTITGEKNFTGGLKVNGSPIYYDTEKKYWKLEGDLLVTGGVTMYGSDSSFTPSTIMDAIAVDGTTISKDGGVLKVIGGTGGGVADSVAWANITGKPTWIGSSKPSYSYSEITGAISTTELQNYLTSNSYINITSGDNRYLKLSGGTLTLPSHVGLVIKRTNVNSPVIAFYNNDELEHNYIGFEGNRPIIMNKSGVASTIWHSGNFTPSNYLPLSGGTLDGVLTLRAPSSSYDSWIEFSNKSNSVVHKLGVRRPESSYGLQYYNGSEYYKIWHEGNDGSGSGLDADMLDGYHVTHFMSYIKADGYVQANLLNSELWNVAGGDGYIEYYDNGTWFNSRWGRVLAHYGFDGDLRGNASSATKLQTARTIWGRSFDGTSDISGSLYITNNNAIYIKDTSDNWLNQIEVSSGNAFNIGYSSGGRGYSTLLYGGDITLKVGISRVTSLYIDSNRNGEYNGMFTFKRASQVPLYISNTDSSLTDVCARFVVNNAYKASIGTNSGDYLLRYNADLSKSYVIWDSGNDGHNSGLDADTLDGYHSNAFMNFTATGGYVAASMGNEILSKQASGNGYIEFWDGVGGWFNFICGYVKSSSSMYIASSLFLGDGGEGIYIHGTGVSWHNSSNTWTRSIMYINSNGDVCIGNQQPSARLHVIGDILATGGITMYSMRALKNVVDERGLSLSELSTIKPTRYTWKDGRDNRLHFGGIADDIQQVLPEVVYKTSDGILTMDYGNAAFAVASSLIKPVIDHEKRIAMLEEENKQLRQEVERLKSA